MKSPFKKKTVETSTSSGVSVDPDGRRVIPAGPAQEVVVEGAGVVAIGKKKYAVNLYRQQSDDSPKILAKNTPSVGDAEKWNLYAKAPGNNIILGSTDLGHRKGQLPLGESIRNDLLGPNWTVIALLSDSKVIILKMERGIIVSDEVFNNIDLAREEVMHDRAAPDHPIIAPAGWNIAGATQADLSDLVGQKTPALQKVGFLANNLPRILFFLLMAGVVAFGYYYFKVLGDRAAAEEREMAERRAKRIVVNDNQYPWYETARPEEFLITCANLINDSLRVVPGWVIQPAVCQYTDKKVAATFVYLREDDGRIAWLRKVYEGSPGNVSLDVVGNNGTYLVSKELKSSKELFKETKPWTDENIQRVLVERFQNVGLHPKITSKKTKAPESAQTTQEIPIFNSHTLNLTVGAFPMDIVKMMSDIPATVPKSLIWDPSTNQWTLEVNVYHPAILPLGAT